MRKREPQPVSEQLKRFIEERGASLAQIGRDTGVSHAVLSRFLRGERRLNTKTVDRLCEYLGVELRKVRRGKGE